MRKEKVENRLKVWVERIKELSLGIVSLYIWCISILAFVHIGKMIMGRVLFWAGIVYFISWLTIELNE